jgi:hypothetical protein
MRIDCRLHETEKPPTKRQTRMMKQVEKILEDKKMKEKVRVNNVDEDGNIKQTENVTK